MTNNFTLPKCQCELCVCEVEARYMVTRDMKRIAVCVHCMFGNEIDVVDLKSSELDAEVKRMLNE